jgi:type II secretory ATPase GspE/PulE/Tfp pilus assembly ATPase PilB-like protein
LSYTALRAVKRALQEPSGLILVSGPTGSGKTTTLAAFLQYLINGQRCIVTIENPVEYKLPTNGPVKQIEVKGEITFAKALRKALRLDPEVILVGEIRDEETMEIALQAAQTGHLVLATLHANSAPETLSRALDLTMDKRRDAFRLAEVVKFVVAQRLMRRYSGEVTERDLVPDELAWLKANGLGFMKTVREAQGGHRIGMLPLVEAFAVNPGIKSLVRSGSLDAGEIYRLAGEQPQFETLASAGIRAVQTKGCRVRDCMSSLEATAEAATHPSWRMRLARDHGLTLSLVDVVVDRWTQLEDEGHFVAIETLLEQIEEHACADAI